MFSIRSFQSVSARKGHLRVGSMQRCGMASSTTKPAPPKEGVNWGALSFGLTRTDKMYLSKTRQGAPFQKGKLEPYGPLALEPSATVLNYGQGIFEGLKAFRTSKGRIAVFRPVDNAKRMQEGGLSFVMEPVPTEVFLDGIDQVVIANSHWVPPEGQGALYLRPLLFGSGAQLGVAPSNEYTFCIFASPVGNYFKGGQVPINLITSTEQHRAAPKGSGSTKAIGNYAPCFKSQKKAKQSGFDEVLYLDAVQEKFVEEAGASNFFVVNKDNVVRTPPTDGTILAGVTRMSLLQLAKEKLGLKVDESPVSLEEVFHSKEAFCSGTGASISPVGSVTHKGKKTILNDGKVGKVTSDLYKLLLDIQFERIPDPYKWLHYPFKN